jgi:hypothetical protein
MPLPLNPLEWAALAYLALLWIGYDRYARHRACPCRAPCGGIGRPGPDACCSATCA